MSSEVWEDVEALSVSDREQRQASTQRIRQGPLDKEWDSEHTIPAGEYNLPASPLFTFLFSLPSFSSSISFLCLWCLSCCWSPPLHSLSFSLPSHSVSHTMLSPVPCSSPGFQLWDAEMGTNVTVESKAHFSFRLCYIFPFTSFSSVFLIDWPGGLADPERDEWAEQHKKLGLWTRHALLLAYTATHAPVPYAHAYIHSVQSLSDNTHTSCSVSMMGEMCIDIWKLVSAR